MKSTPRSKSYASAKRAIKRLLALWIDDLSSAVQYLRPCRPMRHTISILVENKFGVLARIAGMFSGRGFNIDTLNVGPTLDATASRMTIVVRGDDKVLEQVIKQLEKLVDVIDVQDFRDEEYVDRELVLLRVTRHFENALRSDADLRCLPRQDH